MDSKIPYYTHDEIIAEMRTVGAMNSELLPCPFCGELTFVNYWPGGCYIMCHHAGCIGSLIDAHYSTEAEAIAAWNTRAERTCRNEYGRCSVCDAIMYDAPNYCSNCGARVVER